MGVLDNLLIPKVRATLQKYGTTVTIRSYPALTSSFGSNEVTKGAPLDVNVLGTTPLNYDNKLVDGVTIRSGDAYALISGESTTVPTTGTEYVFQGKAMQIVAVKPYYGQDSIIVYEVQLRAAA